MTQERQFDYLFKIVIVGDSGVGKSNLLTKYTNNYFQECSKATIGVQLSTKFVQIQGQLIQNQIWDTAGQERFRAITSAYYRNAVGAIIVFDLTKPKSFQNITKWLREVQDFTQPFTSVIVIGNKADLAGSREAKSETIQNFMVANKLSYLQTSALTGYNVPRTFQKLIGQIYQKQKKKSIGRKSHNPAFSIDAININNINSSSSSFPKFQKTKISKQKQKSKKKQKNCC